ncbi:MAG: clostripain-related cysteine peptidase [Rikenellaceae bacterium]
MKFLHAAFISLLLFVSCKKEPGSESGEMSDFTDQTVFVYMPWATNLADEFENNINDLLSAFTSKASEDVRVVIFYAATSSSATLTEYRYFNGSLIENELKEYDVSTFITSDGITSLIDEVVDFAPSSRYSMIVSAHGMAWIPTSSSKSAFSIQKNYWEYEDALKTKYFGGLSSSYQINVTDFASGIQASNIHMEYILFDACYMSNIEALYDLKDVTDYIIASPTEIMAYGYPYKNLGPYLLGDVDYEGVSNGFYSFYSTYSSPYGTIGIINCSEMDAMAEVMLKVNNSGLSTSTSNVQRLCGYSPTLFYDFGSLINNTCYDSDLVEEFNSQLAKLVPYSSHTSKYYASGAGAIYLYEYSGISTSQYSTNSQAANLSNTSWYIATH